VYWIAAFGFAAALAAFSALFLSRQRRAASCERDHEEALREPNTAAVRWIIVLAWAYSVIPPFLGLMALGRQGNKIGTLSVITAMQGHVAVLLSVAIAVLCARLIVLNLNATPAKSAWRLAAFLLPWIAIEVVPGIGAGYSPGRQFLLYPLVGIALWLVSPSVRVISTLGVLALTTAAFSLVLGLVSPLGLVDAGPAGIDKNIIGSGSLLLAGPYNASNGLGLSLALGLASITCLRSARLRTLGFGLTWGALLWTGSRTSILAAAVVSGVYLLARGRSPRGLRVVGTAAIAGGIVLIASMPLQEMNPYAYTQRGAIWIASLSTWHHHLWLGSGPEFYERPNDLGFYALYGHNLFVDTVARSGIVGVIGITVVIVTLVWSASQLATVSSFPLLFTIAFIFSSILEVPLALNNLNILGYATWIPFAVILFTSDGADLHSRVALAARPVRAIVRTPATTGGGVT
jgi:hypothetical protein